MSDAASEIARLRTELAAQTARAQAAECDLVQARALAPRQMATLTLLLLAAFMLTVSQALAHNVTAGDAGYIQEIWGVKIIPFMYLGAKHMVTGYDHILFLLGGVAENTPLERTIANRGVHAPLLSLAGRHWFTDTTNGFRAYSTRYLLDPRVQPFRNVFQRYELLFYLTVRAGQIGMCVYQVPVQRRYPKDAPSPPTKITGVAGKADVLKQTFAAAAGRYNP